MRKKHVAMVALALALVSCGEGDEPTGKRYVSAEAVASDLTQNDIPCDFEAFEGSGGEAGSCGDLRIFMVSGEAPEGDDVLLGVYGPNWKIEPADGSDVELVEIVQEAIGGEIRGAP